MASGSEGNRFSSEAVQIENLHLSLKRRTKRKLADRDIDGDSQDSRDRDAFFERVQTFSIITWFGKPPALSPLQCAKYGWINLESDMLQCRMCRAVICAMLPVNSDPKIYQMCVKKLTEKLKSGHEQACKWRSNPTPDSLIRVPTHDKAEVTEEFNQRLQSLLSCENRLPYLNTASTESQGITDSTLSVLTEYLLNKTSDREAVDPEVVKRAALISLCGWKIRSDNTEDIMSCDFCQRTIGLWNYKSPHWHETHQNSESGITKDLEDTVREEVVTEEIQNAEKVPNGSAIVENDQNGHENLVDDRISDDGQNSSAKVTDTVSEKEMQVSGNGAISSGSENESLGKDSDETKAPNIEKPSDQTENICEMVSETRKSVELDGVQNGAKESKETDEHDSGTNGVDATDGTSPSKVAGEDSDSDEKNKENEEEASENNCSETKDKGKEHIPEISTVKSNGHREEETKENNPREQSCEVSRSPDRAPPAVTNSTQDTTAGEQGRKRIKLEEKDSFDPLAEHRTWCSWLQNSCDTSPWKQSGSEVVSPWKKILYIVCPTLKDDQANSLSLSSHYKQVSPVAAFGRVCRILNDWTGGNSKD